MFNALGIDSAIEFPNAIQNNLNNFDFYHRYLNFCPDLSVDYMQMIFQYYLSDRKEKKQDYTPKLLAKACVKLAGIEGAKSCYDMCAGSGALTIQAWSINKDCEFICEEFDERVIPLLLFNLSVRNINAIVIRGDVLAGKKSKSYKLTASDKFSIISEINPPTKIKTDICISNPPYNMKWEPPVFAQMQSRFINYGLPPESNANYAFILTALDEVKEKATLILPSGVLNTQVSSESEIKSLLIERNLIESVVICPNNMFTNTTIGTCLLTLNKSKTTAHVEMVDMRKRCTKEVREQNGQYGGASHTNRMYEKTLNVFSDEQIEELVQAIKSQKNESEFCKSVSIEEIKSQKYKLVPSMFIDFEYQKSKHREYSEIVADINRIVKQKNACKLTINESLAKALGFDIELFKLESDAELNNFLKKISGTKLVKHNYFSTTKNKNEIKFENADKDILSSIFMTIFAMWKQHVYYLNQEENRYLAELRDALLPDLLSGKIEV